MLIRPHIFGSHVITAQSTRKGGVSSEPFNTLNLGRSVNDDPLCVAENRERFFTAAGADLQRLSLIHQVHGDKIHIATAPGYNEGFDAQITNVSGLALVISVADCTPILIHDERNHAVAAVHAGWRGTAAGIVLKTMALMQTEYGTIGRDCKAFIGACISREHFETGEEVAIRFDARFSSRKPGTEKWLVDLKAANRQQLLDCGLSSGNIEVSDLCSYANSELFFSHRRDNGRTGRMMALIGIR